MNKRVTISQSDAGVISLLCQGYRISIAISQGNIIHKVSKFIANHRIDEIDRKYGTKKD